MLKSKSWVDMKHNQPKIQSSGMKFLKKVVSTGPDPK